MNAQRIYIVDDDEAVRKSLSRLLVAEGFDVEAFGDARLFLSEIDVSKMGCVLLDLSMPEMDGLALQQALLDRRSPMSIVFLTGRATMKDCVIGMQRGASNFLVKPYVADELIQVLHKGLAESHRRTTDFLELQRAQMGLRSLTQRESEVMELVARGLLNKQIADLIGAAERTVKLHRARVMEKLQVGSVAELVRLVDLVNGAPKSWHDGAPRP